MHQNRSSVTPGPRDGLCSAAWAPGCVQMWWTAGRTAQLTDLLLKGIICRPCRGSCTAKRCREKELSVSWCVSSRELREFQTPTSVCADWPRHSQLLWFINRGHTNFKGSLCMSSTALNQMHIQQGVWSKKFHKTRCLSTATACKQGPKVFNPGKFPRYFQACRLFLFLPHLTDLLRENRSTSQSASFSVHLPVFLINIFLKVSLCAYWQKNPNHSKRKEAKRKWKKTPINCLPWGWTRWSPKVFSSPNDLSFNDLASYSHILILLSWKIISIEKYVKI